MATPSSPAVLTLPEVVATIPAILARDYEGVRNGRVRDLPDVRTIRWYQSLGILDRPGEFRGRAALYRRRHLLQIAAIKKLQASGLALEQIQEALPGRSDAELARALGRTLDEIDRVIADRVAARASVATAGIETAMSAPPARAAFWKARPAATSAPLVAARHEAPPAAAEPALQSITVGEGVVVLWNGRPLTPSELTTLRGLSAPLTAFLSSTSSLPAEQGKASSHRRPPSKKEPRP